MRSFQSAREARADLPSHGVLHMARAQHALSRGGRQRACQRCGG